MNHIKNLTIYKKLLSILSAFTIMLTPISGLTEESKEDSKTNEPGIEEMVDEQIAEERVQETKEKKQMTIEEFRENRDALRAKYRPLAKEYRRDIEAIDRLYYIINFEHCMDIMDELFEEGIDIVENYPLYGSYFVVRIVSYIFDSANNTGKLNADFTDFIYDATPEEEEFAKKLTALTAELCNGFRHPSKLKKATLKEIIDLCESEDYSIRLKIFMTEIFQPFIGSIEGYINDDVKKSELKKYLDLEKSDLITFVLLDGVELNKDSDNIVELAIYGHEMALKISREAAAFMKEFDENYRNEHSLGKQKSK